MRKSSLIGKPCVYNSRCFQTPVLSYARSLALLLLSEKPNIQMADSHPKMRRTAKQAYVKLPWIFRLQHTLADHKIMGIRHTLSSTAHPSTIEAKSDILLLLVFNHSGLEPVCSLIISDGGQDRHTPKAPGMPLSGCSASSTDSIELGLKGDSANCQWQIHVRWTINLL